MRQVKWIVGLSNGESIKEREGIFSLVSGELSPWQKLLLYVKDKNLTITSLSLCADDGKRWNLPSAGKNPKFKAFADAPKPVEYKFFRKVALDLMGKSSGPEGYERREEDRYIVAQALYDDGRKLQIWVDEQTLNSWSVVL